MAAGDMINTSTLMTIRWGIRVILSILSQQIESVQCWYYRPEGFMIYAIVLACGIILSRDRVTIDGVWIGKRIYWSVKTTRDYTLQITITQRAVSSFTVFSALLGSGFQRRTSPFLWVPELSLAPATRFSLLATAALNWLFACRLSLDWLVKSKLCYDRRSVGQSFLVSSPHLGPKIRFCYC
jgi:hypothetical protein